jgi:hypothetical protein
VTAASMIDLLFLHHICSAAAAAAATAAIPPYPTRMNRQTHTSAPLPSSLQLISVPGQLGSVMSLLTRLAWWSYMLLRWLSRSCSSTSPSPAQLASTGCEDVSAGPCGGGGGGSSGGGGGGSGQLSAPWLLRQQLACIHSWLHAINTTEAGGVRADRYAHLCLA